MRRKLSLIILMFFCVNIYAQNEVDALRFSYLNPTGTARYLALGGAMGALGGDFTAMHFNPAGVAVFRSNNFSITPLWNSNKTKTNYYEQVNSRNKYSLQLANIGFVSAVESSSNSENVKFVNFGFSYNQHQNFNRKLLISGFNDKGSLLDIETERVIDGEQDNLFLAADLIYPDPDDTTTITNDFWRHGYGANQTKSVYSKGYAGEYSFMVGANFKDRIYIGASLSIFALRYKEKSDYKEEPLKDFPDLHYFNNIYDLKTRGGGVNLKIGVIGRVTNWLRLGLALHTPTAFGLTDTYTSEVNARIEYEKGIVDNQAKSNTKTFDWQLITPFKAIFSTALVWKKMGLLSLDYEITDYSLCTLEAEDYIYRLENDAIRKLYKTAHNIKIGAEYNLGAFTLRAGYSILGSPYKSEYDNSISKISNYSGGIGFRAGNIFLDITGRYSSMKEYFYIYGTDDSKSNIQNSNFSYLATIGFKF